MDEITIHIDQETSNIILHNCAGVLTSDKRLLMSLRRLGFQVSNQDVLIHFEDATKITTLDEVQRLLEKFGFKKSLTEATIKDVESFEREDRLFDQFSEKAQCIRDNEFERYPQLIDDFDNFQRVLNIELKRKLYPLQLLSAFHMAFSQNSCNFAVPGAGKTSIVYGAYAYLKQLPVGDPRRVDKLLVIGPLSSFAPWENEYEACFGTKIISQRLSGDSTISREIKEEHLYSGNAAELTLIYHGGVMSLQQEIIDFLKSNSTMVVVDEAHRIKNPDGQWGRSAVEISKEARSRIILTGTPVPNGYEDLYNLYQFIYPFKFKSILGYHYANLLDMTSNSSIDSDRVKKFTENISPFFIRIKKDDLGLPPIKEKIIEVDMNDRQREIYDFIETEYVQSFKLNSSGTVKDILNRAKMIRLRQASTNPALLSKTLKDSLENNLELGEVDPNARYTVFSDEFVDDSEFFHQILTYSDHEVPQKFIETKKLLEENIIINEEKAIVWTIFVQNAKELQSYLLNNEIQSKLLIGEVPQSERESIITKFNDPDNFEFHVVIANPFAVAESISLHKGCHNAIYLERDYNCSNFLQSKDRIHRVGLPKDKETNYYYIIAKNSIDSVIDQRLKVKIERMNAIIDEDIPLFSRINDDDETDLIKALIEDYAQRTQ